MYAAEKGHVATVQALLCAGADCKLQCNAGATALSLAIEGQHEDAIRILRAHEF